MAMTTSSSTSVKAAREKGARGRRKRFRFMSDGEAKGWAESRQKRGRRSRSLNRPGIRKLLTRFLIMLADCDNRKQFAASRLQPAEKCLRGIFQPSPSAKQALHGSQN